LATLPPGLTELYAHPATHRDPELIRLMPGYDHVAEFAALMAVAVPGGIELTTYSDLQAGYEPQRRCDTVSKSETNDLS